MSSKLDKEIVELTTLYSEATKDLDDVQREAFRKKYIGIANEQSKMSPEEIDELVSDIVGKKKKGKVEKTLKDQRLQLRMKQRQ